MKLLPRFMAWFREKNGKSRFEGEMDEELRFHLESIVEENIKAGMSPEEARRTAQISFGGIDQIKEGCRDTRWTRWLDQLSQDLHYAVRILSRNPIPSLIIIILIAEMIGSLCAAFAVLDAVLLRTLPIPRPEQLVAINPTASISSSIYDALQRERQNISQIFGMKGTVTYGNTGNVDRSLYISLIKGDYFDAMGTVPQMGRFIKADEQDAVAVISDRLWRSKYAGSPDIIGRRIQLGLSDFTIVGVAQPGFILVEEPYSDWEVIVPCDAFARSQGNELWSPLQVIARLKDDKTAEEYEAQLNSLWPAILDSTLPPQMTLDRWREISGSRIQVVPVPRGINYVLILNQSIPSAIHITFVLSVLIFLSGCLALILIAIARAIRNRRQVAILTAIGGGRWRIQRPFFLEALILSVLGCTLGLMIAFWWSRLGTSFLPGDKGINWHVRIDGHVITLALLTALFITAVISLVTALFGFRGSSTRIMHAIDPVSRSNERIRTGLLAVELAISVLLIHYALFFAVGYSRLIRVPFGFNPENLHVYTLLAKPPGKNIPENYFPRLMSQIEQIAEVESVTVTTGRPPATWPLEYKQPVRTDDGREVQATVIPVSPNYFRTLNLPLLLGRDFSWSDQNTAIINEALFKKLYPDRDSLKHTISYGESSIPLQIIGVSGNMTYFGPRHGNSSTLFVSCADELETLHSGTSIMIRSRRSLEKIKQEVQALLDPLGAYYISRSVDQQTYLSSSIQQERMLATISGIFGAVILLLAGVELFAFCNYLLAMRTKELAIRASVGAGMAHIAKALLKEIIKALGIGLAIGFALIYIGERIFAHQVGLESAPGFAYQVFAIAIVAGVTISAVLVPALQALRINPAQALRVD